MPLMVTAQVPRVVTRGLTTDHATESGDGCSYRASMVQSYTVTRFVAGDLLPKTLPHTRKPMIESYVRVVAVPCWAQL